MSKDLQVNAHLSLERKTIFEIEEKFDVVMMHHAFEHLDQPKMVLQKAAELLRPGGKLLIRIPVADSYARAHYGVNWVQWDAPRHLFLHSSSSLKKMALDCGLKPIKTVYDSNTFQFWGSELYKRGLALKTKGREAMFSQSEMQAFEKQAHQLNLEGKGDQACFYFVKA